MEGNAARLERKAFELQNTVYKLVQERPEWRSHLQEMVAWEEANPVNPANDNDKWSGFLWHDVHTPARICAALAGAGVLDVRSSSRAYTYYRLCSVAATREALALDAEPAGREEGSIDVAGLFALVYGHEKVKALLTYAVGATSPVHCLLVGAPGTAKTLLLHDIGNLPGAQFYVGSTTTKAGLVAMLLAVRPRFLVIDEIDKMDAGDMTPLLNLMESGVVTRLQGGARDRVTIETRVFAGANDLRRIPGAILSRFAKFEIPPYNASEFMAVAQAVLVQREGQGPEMAKLIAAEVVKHSTDIRDAVRVARMARKDPRRVLDVTGCLWPRPPASRPVPLPLKAKE